MSNILKALKHTFAVGDTAYTFSDNSITDETIIDVYFTKDIPYEVSQNNNTVTVEISPLSYAVGCAIVINNVDSVDYPITAENVSYFDSNVKLELLEHRSELNELINGIGLLDSEKQDNLTAGTNITISDNVISASGGGVDYSTEEQNTGLKWLDGSTIYQKTYIVSNASGLATGQWLTVFDSTNMNLILIKDAVATRINGLSYPLPHLSYDGWTDQIVARRNQCYVGSNYTGSSWAIVKVEITVLYTKAV